jgi:hypothetical protein
MTPRLLALVMPIATVATLSVTYQASDTGSALAFPVATGSNKNGVSFDPNSIFPAGTLLSPLARRSETIGNFGELMFNGAVLASLIELVDSDDPIAEASDLIERHGDKAYSAIWTALTDDRFTKVRREFIESISELPPAKGDAKDIILNSALHSSLPGDRTVAASALGNIGTSYALAALSARQKVETNRVVRMTIEAHLARASRVAAAV